MKTRFLLWAAIALMAISCSESEDNVGGDEGGEVPPTEEGIYSMTADEFVALTASSIPDEDTWVITGNIVMEAADFSTMMLDIDETLGDREISLIFEEETSLGFMTSTVVDGSPVPALLDNFVSITAEDVTFSVWANWGGCTWLKEVNFPSLETLTYGEFFNCDALTSLSLPMASAATIYMCGTCSNLETVELPTAIRVWQYAFAGCSSLTTLKLTSPYPITLDDGAFDSTSAFIQKCTLYLHYANSDLADSENLKDNYEYTYVTEGEDGEEVTGTLVTGYTFGKIVFVDSEGNKTDKDGNILNPSVDDESEE
ncbi:MAG: leucine-rich repeat protein [Rikenellaceae bacterium]